MLLSESDPNMTDIASSETRSRLMSGIQGKNTAPEMRICRALHLK